MGQAQKVSEFNYDNISKLLEQHPGTFFSVKFVKRTTKEVRSMICRTGVKKALKGGSLSFDPKEKGLIIVFDTQKEAYRSIPTENIQEITVAGCTYHI